MLKLLVFAPCERVIVGEEDHLTSMIAIMERVTIHIIENKDEPLPIDAVIPMKWTICTLWHREDKLVAPETYEQQIRIYRPDGEVALTAVNTFDITNNHVNFRHVLSLDKVPMGVPGFYRLVLGLRKKGDDQWPEVAEYPFEIVHENAELVT